MLQGCDPRPFVRETGPEQTAKAVCQSYVPRSNGLPQIPPLMLTVEIPRLSTGVLVASAASRSFAPPITPPPPRPAVSAGQTTTLQHWGAQWRMITPKLHLYRTFKATFHTLEAQYRQGPGFGPCGFGFISPHQSNWVVFCPPQRCDWMRNDRLPPPWQWGPLGQMQIQKIAAPCNQGGVWQ